MCVREVFLEGTWIEGREMRLGVWRALGPSKQPQPQLPSISVRDEL